MTDVYLSEMRRKILTQLNELLSVDINAYVSLDIADALRQINQQAENKSRSDLPLQGVTFGIKDLIDVAGQKTTMGSEQYRFNVAKRDAPVVTSIKKAGGIILGKTNTHEFAYGPTGDESFFGPVLNPNNKACMTGGSSSGSAAAVAANLCDVALGTDTAASVRLPAALCGVIGLKPTFDLISRENVFALSKTLDHVGILSKSVEQNVRTLEVLTGKSYSANINSGVFNLKIGVPKIFYGEFICDAVGGQFKKALDLFKDHGAKIIEIEVPDIYEIYRQSQIVLQYEAFQIHEPALTGGAPFTSEVRVRAMRGKDITKEQYEAAKQYQTRAVEAFDEVLAQVDLLASPTCGILAPKLQERETRINGELHSTLFLLMRLTAPTNFSGHPGISFPIGKVDGLPVGLQLSAGLNQEAVLFQACAFLEKQVI